MEPDLKDIEAIYHAALEKEAGKERSVYLEGACRGNDALRAEIDALFETQQEAGDFLESPALCPNGITLGSSPVEGPGTMIGLYKLLEKIGEGGMAVVYMAQQTHPLNRRVALKIIKLGMDTKEVIARFEAERQALAVMDHPNVAKVFDAGATDTGRPYFVMELVRGISITEYCDKNKLSTQDRLALFMAVCNAVHHAHQKGIIHRDLKPTNIMVTMHDDKPVPKVIDFGIAKATNRQLTEKTVFTRYAQMIGTPEYMSPEQAQMSGLDLDTRTDIYSLGIVLYELLTGTLPFDGATLRAAGFAEIQRIIGEEEPLRPSTRLSALGKAAEEIAARRSTNVAGLAKRLSRELEWIPLKALRKDRTRRYTSAAEFAHDIDNYLNDQPLLAGPESALYRFRKVVHKYRIPVAIVCAVAGALILGLAVSTSLYMNLRRAQSTVSELTTQSELNDKLSTVQRLFAQGRYQEGLNEIKSRFDEEDLVSQVRLIRAQLLMEMGELDEARTELLRLTDVEAEVASSAHYLLAPLYLTSDPTRSEQHREQAESILPQTTEAYYLRAMCAASADEAIALLSKTLELDPQHFAARKARALAFGSTKTFPAMAEDAGVMVALRSKDYLGYALRATARRETGQLQEAVKDHTQAITLCTIEEELPRLYEQRIETSLKMHDYGKVLADAQQCVKLSPDAIDGYVHTFIAYMMQREYEKARAVYTRFVHRITGPNKKRVWFFEGALEKYVFDCLEAGQSFTLPPDIGEQLPFYLMQQSAELYALLKEKARPLTVSKGFWLDGDISQDGRYLVYQRHVAFSWLPGALGGNDPAMNKPRIEIMDLKTGETRQTRDWGYHMKWSPDGEYIAYTKLLSTDTEKGVWVMSTAGGLPRRLAAGRIGKWARDSKHLYFGQNKTLFSIAIDVSNAEPVPMPEAPLGLISPDEDFVAVPTVTKGTLSEIRILTFPEGKEIARWRLPWPLRRWVTPFQWHPSGKALILNSRYYDNEMGMCLFDIETGQTRHVSDFTRPWCRAMWSPDGSRLLVCPFGMSPWVMEIDPERPLEEVLAPALSTEDFLSVLRKKWDNRIAADPGYAKHYVSRAILLLAAGDYEQAEQDLKQGAQLVTDPNDPAIHALSYWAEQYANADCHRELEIMARVDLALANN